MKTLITVLLLGASNLGATENGAVRKISPAWIQALTIHLAQDQRPDFQPLHPALETIPGPPGLAAVASELETWGYGPKEFQSLWGRHRDLLLDHVAVYSQPVAAALGHGRLKFESQSHLFAYMMARMAKSLVMQGEDISQVVLDVRWAERQAETVAVLAAKFDRIDRKGKKATARDLSAVNALGLSLRRLYIDCAPGSAAAKDIERQLYRMRRRQQEYESR